MTQDKYLPNDLLAHAQEEAAEVIKAISKAERFGYDNRFPEDGEQTNEAKLLCEMADATLTFDRLRKALRDRPHREPPPPPPDTGGITGGPVAARPVDAYTQALEDTPLTKFWMDNYVDKKSGLCGLCGNTGRVHVNPASRLPSHPGWRSFDCLCPNGRVRAAKKEKPNGPL